MLNAYLYEYLLEVDGQERARKQRHEQQLREAGIVDHTPRAWLAIVAALLAFLRLG